MKNNYIYGIMEAKYHGQLPSNKKVLNFALDNPEFTEQWLCHSISSSNCSQELAIVLCLAKHHKIDALYKLEYFWPKKDIDLQKSNCFSEYLSSLPITLQYKDDVSLANLWARLTTPDSRDLNTDPSPVKLFQSSLNQELIEEVINVASESLNLAAVYTETAKGQRVQDIRDNEQLITPLPVNNILDAILQRLMCSDNFSYLAHAEPLVIYRYKAGQQYKWHYDFITPSNQQVKQELAFFGQRLRTRIINLNDGFEGGETAFKHWNLCVKPKQGQIISFDNMRGDQVDETSVHCGKPVLAGEKWICTLWMREKPFWLRGSIWRV